MRRVRRRRGRDRFGCGVLTASRRCERCKRRRGRVPQDRRNLRAEQTAKAQTARAVEVIFVCEKVWAFERQIRLRGQKAGARRTCDFDQRSAGYFRAGTMQRARWNSNENDRDAGAFIALCDWKQPFAAIACVRRARLGQVQHLGRNGGAPIGRNAVGIKERSVFEIGAQARERFASRMRCERRVRISFARCCERAHAGRRIGGEILNVVAQFGPAQKEIDAVLHALARIGKRTGQLGKVAQPCLKDDVTQIHRAVVAVEAADCAVVVVIGVDRNDHGAKTIGPRIDCANEKGPAARRGAGDTGVQETI